MLHKFLINEARLRTSNADVMKPVQNRSSFFIYLIILPNTKIIPTSTQEVKLTVHRDGVR